ncbi:hypothetical protein [Kibdelosporangium philippinense]|uniref:hypothetical protein n=1 Tax=Kibdelosporangium philippinense TaxID=211113 RepID=UPI00360DE7D4
MNRAMTRYQAAPEVIANTLAAFPPKVRATLEKQGTGISPPTPSASTAHRHRRNTPPGNSAKSRQNRP